MRMMQYSSIDAGLWSHDSTLGLSWWRATELPTPLDCDESNAAKMSQDLPPQAMRRAIVKSTVGDVKRSCVDLPDMKNSNHVYGLALPRDPENAGEVVAKWVSSTPSPAAQCGRSFIETNKQAINAGYITAGEARQFAVDHPEILVRTPVKRKSGYTPGGDTIYGIKSKESEDFTALIQAKFTNFSSENEDYPDLTNMKIKGKLPHPRETKSSALKDIRVNPKPKEKDHTELFKMSKFRNVGSMLCTQPNARRDSHIYDDDS